MGFISADLGTDPVTKSGYDFVLAAGNGAAAGPLDCNGAITQSGYLATAVPTGYGTTGSKSYATNAGNTVYQIWAGTAPVEGLLGVFAPPAIPIG
jgi:hypothetical protein